MTPLKRYSRVFLVLLISFLTLHCSKDETGEIPENLVPTGRLKVYKMFGTNGSASNGTATFIENEGGYLTVNLSLKNTEIGDMHPAFIHRRTAAEGGGVTVPLTPIDGNTGSSSTTFFKLNDGSKFGFDELLQFSGYINVVSNENNQTVDISQGDIGRNELTGNSVIYKLNNETEGVIGTVSLNERLNETTLVLIGLENNPVAGNYPSHFHYGNGSEVEGIAISLQPTDGTAGFGQSQVFELDDGTSITYGELITFEGYVDVHESSGNGFMVIARGDIDAN